MTVSKFAAAIVFLFATFFCSLQSAFATTTTWSVACVVPSGSCTGIAGLTTLKGDTIAAANYTFVSTTPPFKPQGGGVFQDIGPCDNASPHYSTTAPYHVSDQTIALNTTANLVVGTLVGGTNLSPYTQIKSIPDSTDIAITVPATGTGSGTLTMTPSNTGTIFMETATNHCVVKVDYSGDPHEWGALGDGQTDDEVALQYWLASPGPWNASIPGTYDTSMPLSCWPDVELQGTATKSGGDSQPPVEIAVHTGFTGGSSSAHAAVITAYKSCRISGVSIDAFNPQTSPTCGTTNCYVDAVDIGDGGSVIIDNHSSVVHGYNNVYCFNTPDVHVAGAQLKDSQFSQSFSDNLYLDCPNIRLIGDIIEEAGSVNGKSQLNATVAAGIHVLGEDVTISNGNVEASQGIGIWLDSASLVSITGMFIENNGNDPPAGTSGSGGAGIEIDGSKHITVCGNHLDGNDNVANTSPSYSAQVRFDQSGGTNPNDVTFCSNVYNFSSGGFPPPPPPPPSVPNYVYDINHHTATDVSTVTLYECPMNQVTGVFSPNATTLANNQIRPPTLPPNSCGASSPIAKK